MTNPTPHDTLSELFGLLGETEVWPKEIQKATDDQVQMTGYEWYYVDHHTDLSPIEPADALAILTHEVEGWLRDEMSKILGKPMCKLQYEMWMHANNYDITAAVRHQLAKEVGRCLNSSPQHSCHHPSHRFSGRRSLRIP